MVTSFEIVGEPSPSPSSTTPEQNIVPAAVVAKGLRDMTNAIRSGTPADELYTLWYGFEGTIRRQDQAAGKRRRALPTWPKATSPPTQTDRDRRRVRSLLGKPGG